MSKSLYPKQPLTPIRQLNEVNIRNLKIGEDFVDLARLGMVGEYTRIEANQLCPRLYYRWNYQFGNWEVYATEHDLIKFNSVSISRLNPDGGGQPTPGPGPTPDPPTPEPPEPEPDVAVSCPDDSFTWTFNGAIMRFSVVIKWDSVRRGYYVPVTFKLSEEYQQYLSTLVITYRGAKYGHEIFKSGETTLYVSVRVPGQIVPIRFDFTDEVCMQFMIVIDDNAKFEK